MRATEIFEDQLDGKFGASQTTTLVMGPPFPEEDMQEVKKMQAKLEELGYPVGVTGIDGKYGMRTAKAVRAWKMDFRVRGSAFDMTSSDLEKLYNTKEKKQKPAWTPNASLPQGSGAGNATPDMDLLTMIKEFETFQSTPYWDKKQWSVGYGSYAGSRDKDDKPDIELTEPEAEALLKKQLTRYIKNVEHWNKVGRYNWNKKQKEALISFAYNVGSIAELTAKGKRDNATIAKKMLEYVYSNGEKLKGLVKRRKVEWAKFKMNTPELSSGI